MIEAALRDLRTTRRSFASPRCHARLLGRPEEMSDSTSRPSLSTRRSGVPGRSGPSTGTRRGAATDALADAERAVALRPAQSRGPVPAGAGRAVARAEGAAAATRPGTRRSRRRAEQIDELRKEIHERPADTEPHWRLGKAAVEGGMTSLAPKSFRAALALDPRCMPAREGLAALDLPASPPQLAGDNARPATPVNPSAPMDLACDAPAVPDARPRGGCRARSARSLCSSSSSWPCRPGNSGGPPRPRPSVPGRDRLSSGREPDGPYVGSRACRECHPREAASHRLRATPSTLRAGRRHRPWPARLDGRVVADPETAGRHLDVRAAGTASSGSPRATAAGGDREYVLDYAFGSGHHAATFVTHHRPGEADRAGASADALHRAATRWGSRRVSGGGPLAGDDPSRAGAVARGDAQVLRLPLHPGLDRRAEFPRPSRPDPQRLLRALPRPRPEARGAKPRAGRTDLRMPFGAGSWTAEVPTGLCGQCHRHPSRAAPA